MKLADCLIAWTPPDDHSRGKPTFGKVQVFSFPDIDRLSDGYTMSDGMCMALWQSATHWQRLALLFTLFNTMVVRDGIDPREAHRALLQIEEYRRMLPDDQEGADPSPLGHPY